MSQPAMTPAEFEAALRAKGDYYHIHHPFHRAMYEGRSTRAQIQGWVANRLGKPVSGVADRASHNRESMEATLARLAEISEAG